MRVLVAACSSFGAAGEIVDEVGRTLEERGFNVRVASLDDVTDVSGFDAFVLGSAVYVGHWLGPARTFVEEHASELAAGLTWLFSFEGPIGDPPTRKRRHRDRRRHPSVLGGGGGSERRRQARPGCRQQVLPTCRCC